MRLKGWEAEELTGSKAKRLTGVVTNLKTTNSVLLQ